MKYLDPDATKTWTESRAFVDKIYPNRAEQFIREELLPWLNKHADGQTQPSDWWGHVSFYLFQHQDKWSSETPEPLYDKYDSQTGNLYKDGEIIGHDLVFRKKRKYHAAGVVEDIAKGTYKESSKETKTPDKPIEPLLGWQEEAWNDRIKFHGPLGDVNVGDKPRKIEPLPEAPERTWVEMRILWNKTVEIIEHLNKREGK